MTLGEFYELAGGRYDEVLGRLPSEAFVKRFLGKFPDDPSYKNLKRGLEEKNLEEAFRAAHTLKGVCANLGLDGLYAPDAELTEVLRAGSFEGTDELFGKVTEQYEIVTDGIRKLDR